MPAAAVVQAATAQQIAPTTLQLILSGMAHPISNRQRELVTPLQESFDGFCLCGAGPQLDPADHPRRADRLYRLAKHSGQVAQELAQECTVVVKLRGRRTCARKRLLGQCRIDKLCDRQGACEAARLGPHVMHLGGRSIRGGQSCLNT